MADTTSYSGAYNYDNTCNKQYRFITIVKSTQWTGNHYVSGQPTKGTYLKNGDMLYYSESGESTYSLSVGVAYGIGCNGVQREHNKKLNNGLPILHKVPPK